MKCKICKKRIWPLLASLHLAEESVPFRYEFVVTEHGDVIEDTSGRAHYICWASLIHSKPMIKVPTETQNMKKRRDPPRSFLRKTPREIPSRPKDKEDLVKGYEDFIMDNPDCISSFVMMPQFSRIVDLFKCSQNDVSTEDLEAILTNEDIRIYVGYGYIERAYNNRYILTPKGRIAYYQNKDFRAEVEKAKKIIKKELMPDTPTFEVSKKLVSTQTITNGTDTDKMIIVTGYENDKDIVELVRIADALMQNGVDPVALLRDKLKEAKNLKEHRYAKI